MSEVTTEKPKPLPTTREIMSSMQWKDAAVVDVKAFDAGVVDVVELVPKIVSAEDAVSNLLVLLADAIIAVRAACTFNGHTDWYGQGGAYRDAYDRMIVRRILEAHPTIPEKRIQQILKNVRDNYLGDAATRAKGMLSDAIVKKAVKAGEVPGAKLVKKDGREVVEIRPTEKDKNTGEEVPKMVPVVDAEGVQVKDKDGVGKETPLVITYIPGSADVPTVLKPAVKKAVQQSGKKGMKVPVRFGGPARGSGGDNKDEPTAWNEKCQKALETFTEALPHLNTLPVAQWLHATMSEYMTALQRPDLVQQEDHATILDDIGHLCIFASAVLRNDGDATWTDLDPFMFQDSDDKSDKQ